jgi:hypothetical protein
MHVVVNHLHLREPFPEALADQMQEVLGRVVGAGGLRRIPPKSTTGT